MIQTVNKLVRDWKKKYSFEAINIDFYHQKNGIFKHCAAELKSGGVINYEKSHSSIDQSRKTERFSILSAKCSTGEPLILSRTKSVGADGKVNKVLAEKLVLFGEVLFDSKKNIDKMSSLPFYIEKLRRSHPCLFKLD